MVTLAYRTLGSKVGRSLWIERAVYEYSRAALLQKALRKEIGMLFFLALSCCIGE